MRRALLPVLLFALATPAPAADLRFDLPLVDFLHVRTKERRGYVSSIVELGSRPASYCWLQLAVSTPERPRVIHLHRDVLGARDPIVLSVDTRAVNPLPWPGGASWSGCRPITRATAWAIVRTPHRFYLDVHTPAFPRGELRARHRGPAR